MKVKPKLREISRHLKDFCKQHSTWITILMLALLFDTLSTIYFMKMIGVEQEIHPIIRFSAMLFGPVAGTFLTAFVYRAVVSVIMAAYIKRLRLFILIAPTVTSTLAGFLNLWVQW